MNEDLDESLNQSNIGYVIIGNQDITKEYNLYKQSIITNRINVKDFVNILKGMRVINYTQDYIIKILNLNTMEEQIFKANDILTL
jgi:beta-galactosidase beta subunit